MTGNIFEILERYDRRMYSMFPDREWFFPSDYDPQGRHLQVATARKRFNIAKEKIFGTEESRTPTIHSLSYHNLNKIQTF